MPIRGYSGPSNKMVDYRGVPLKVGQSVVRGKNLGYQKIGAEVRKIERIEGQKVYLNDSSVPLKFPERIVVVTGFPKIKPTKRK